MILHNYVCVCVCVCVWVYAYDIIFVYFVTLVFKKLYLCFVSILLYVAFMLIL